VKHAPVEVDRAPRTWSLRREWSRAFAVMLILLLIASIATFAGVQQLVGQFRGSAHQLDREASSVLALRTALNAHEDLGHALLSGAPVNRPAFVRQQDQIVRIFDTTLTTFPAGAATRGRLHQAEHAWHTALTRVGLWGDQVATLHGDHPALQAPFGTDSDAARALLDDLQNPSLVSMRARLADGERLERLLLEALTAVFGLALAATAYLRRKMTKDLLRPVAGMHEGVLKLQAGEYDHRIEVVRRDELGELAGAFNAMAGALSASHLALTDRATHDSLTGLANRASLLERLAGSFAPGSERRARHESVLFIDIDDFKDVNDSVGHEGGDNLLMQLAARLNECVRPLDFVARLGGDEFAIVIEDDGGVTAVEVAERILNALHVPFTVGAARLVVSVSIGVAQKRADTVDAAELLRRADFAMYMAKGDGKGCYQIFDAQIHANMVGRSALKCDLATAVSSGQLRVEYQPVSNLRTGEVVGVEALVRWQHPTLGLLGPSAFITLAEETGDIDAIGCWVLETATRQVAGWRRTMEHCADLWVSVNLSAYQLPNPHSLAAVQRILANPATEAGHVVLEVTETALAADVDGGIASLNLLKSLGVRIAVDDFGTGFSSLSTLASLPVDILKIDRSFVSGQASIAPSVPMLEGILGLADKLSLAVIAEGIENVEQLELLRTLGCSMGQGYLLARPASASAIRKLLASGGLLSLPVATA
jgi:diguanylate cyclase (GGDEF)-like protein